MKTGMEPNTPNITFIMARPNGEYVGYEGIVDVEAQTFRLITEPISGTEVSTLLADLEKAARLISEAKTRDETLFYLAKAEGLPGSIGFWYSTVIRVMRRATSRRKPADALKALTVSIRPGPLARLLSRFGVG